MAQIKKLKDTVTSQEFYPVTHKAAVIGLDELKNYDDTELRQLIADKYTKPSTGIPESDLSSDVKTSLGLAKSALQEETYKGTVTDVTLTMPVGFSVKKTGSASKQIAVSFSQDYRLVTPSDVKKWDAAEANVQSDWSETNTESDAFIKNKPSIPSAVTETTVSGWGFTKNTGTYSKPSTGIPKTDLAQDIQTSLGKADTALQSYTEQYTGTYSKPTGGIPKSDLANDVQASLEKADSALQSETYLGTVKSITAGKGLTGGTITESGTIAFDETNYKLPTYAEWEAVTGVTGGVVGTVSSVDLEMPSGFTVTGGPITKQGTFKVSLATDRYIPTTTDKNNWNAAEANVQSDWNETTTTSDAYIKNKPTKLSDFTNDLNISSTITANDEDDDVVILTGTNGTNSVKYKAEHAKKGQVYTSANDITSIGAGTSKFKIPQITVDDYGHVTAAADEEISITIPNTSGYKTKQTAVASPTANGNATAFIDSISQNENGEIVVTKKNITASDLGLSAALKYCGITTTALTDGATTNPVIINEQEHEAKEGCVVFYGDKEFAYNGSTWEELGYSVNLDGYKTKQTAVSDPITNGTADQFIASVSQNENGEITVTKKTVQDATQSVHGLMSAVDKKKLDELTIPTKTSDLTNDSGFITGIPSEYITETELSNKNYLVAADIANKADKSDITVTDVKVNGTSVVVDKVANITINDDDTKCTSLTLSQGAATTPSGDTVEVIENKNITASGTGTSLQGTLTAVSVPTKEYTDKTFATISQVNDYTQVIAGSLVDLNDRLSYHTLDIERRYIKPNTGIPFTDLSESIQTSLNNADTAFGWGDHNNKYLSLEGGTVTGNITAQSFSIPSGSNDYVLLAGGGTKSLAEVLTETDPVFGASPASDVTTDHITTLNDLAGGKITIDNDSDALQIVGYSDRKVATFSKWGGTTVNYLNAFTIDLMDETDSGWGENYMDPYVVELYETERIDDTSPDANEFHTTITPRDITLSASLIEDDILQKTTVAPSGITTPSVLLPEGALELQDGAILCENSEININGGSLYLAESIPIIFQDDDVLSFVDGNEQIITNLDKNGITTTTLSADKIQISGGTDDFILLAGGGYTPLNELATQTYVLNKIAEVQLSGSNVDLSGLATKDDLKSYAYKSMLNDYLPLSGGTLKGDFYIGEGSTALLGASQGQVTLYNDTRLDFSASSGFTTMGLTEYGFIISNDGELRLEGDSIIVNSADSIYFNTSSDTTFDSRVYITNDVHAQAFYETSDARKKDIKEDLSLEKCYDLIDKCQTVIYSLKDQTKEQVGMIAQEIEEFFPEVVATDEEGFKSLAYDRLVVICFKVLKDVIKRLEKLENNGSN